MKFGVFVSYNDHCFFFIFQPLRWGETQPDYPNSNVLKNLYSWDDLSFEKQIFPKNHWNKTSGVAGKYTIVITKMVPEKNSPFFLFDYFFKSASTATVEMESRQKIGMLDHQHDI